MEYVLAEAKLPYVMEFQSRREANACIHLLNQALRVQLVGKDEHIQKPVGDWPAFDVVILNEAKHQAIGVVYSPQAEQSFLAYEAAFMLWMSDAFEKAKTKEEKKTSKNKKQHRSLELSPVEWAEEQKTSIIQTFGGHFEASDKISAWVDQWRTQKIEEFLEGSIDIHSRSTESKKVRL